MLFKFKQQINQYSLCGIHDKVLLAVSGGVDSMTMLHLFRLLDYKVGVAHCNFQLRDRDSEMDELFVQDVCRRMEIPFYAKRFHTEQYAKQHKLSIQMASRALRYAWFAELLDQENYCHLATAHQLNDAIETFLINLVRGSGITGLRGIPVKTGTIIRPMLSISRMEIEKYARLHAISWREDVSNHMEQYDRNAIRLHIVPKMKDLNPSLENTFLRTQRRMEGADELFNLGLESVKNSFVTEDNNQMKIDTQVVSVLQHPVPILWEMIKKYDFRYEQCEEIVRRVKEGSGKFFLSSGHQLTIDRNKLIISPLLDAWDEVMIHREDTEATLGEWRVKVDYSKRIIWEKDKRSAMLDVDTIRFPIRWRMWKKGDYFYPLGMQHRKKLSDFFIDAKLSLADKDRATVMESNGNIIWVAGYRIDDRFKVTDKTAHVITLSLHSHFM